MFTPRRDTTPLINRFPRLGSFAAVLLFAAVGVSTGWAQQPSQPAPPPPPAAQQQNQVPAQGQQGGNYSIQRDVNLVVLHASVVNERGQFVPGLKEDAFRVFEDKAEQKISVFRQEDVPVSVGLVIDNSGSMREKRLQVNAAALTFVKTSNPQDEAFVVNFNDDYYLDTIHDFTNDLTEMKDALERIDARGSTALYDAVIGSLDHLKKGVKDKKVLLVVTDGVDNASRRSLENAVQEAQRSNALIYAIGLFSDEDLKHNRSDMKKARRALTEMANATGGLAFFPESVDDTESICTQIAHDIRNQYTLAYYPTNAVRDGTFRTVQLLIAPQRGLGKLSVRTRAGYYAGSAPARSSGN
jgi:Ca-activated chloride channel family protein